jgi:hypothetical protein
MADWTKPTPTSNYLDFVTEVKNRDQDAAQLFSIDPTNPGVGFFRYNRSLNKFQEWNGSIWANKILSVAGGGTGGSDTASAIAGLGLGTMATQNSGSVNITGGSLGGNGAGLTNLNASALASGTASTARLGSGTADATKFLRGDSTWQAVTVDIPYYPGVQTAPFTANFNYFHNLGDGGGVYVALPATAGNGGKIIGLVKAGTSDWTIYTTGELLLGATSYNYNWPRYSCMILKADPTNNKWDII